MNHLGRIRNMSNAQARSEIKRLNQRIVTIAKRFGTDSETYRATVAPLMTDKFSRYLGESKSGYLKINADVRKAMKDPDFVEMLATAEGSVKTISRLKETAARNLKKEAPEGYEPSEAEIYEEIEKRKYYEQEMAKVEEFIYSHYTEAEAAEAFPELYRGTGSLSYDELDNVINKMNDLKEKALEEVDLI